MGKDHPANDAAIFPGDPLGVPSRVLQLPGPVARSQI